MQIARGLEANPARERIKGNHESQLILAMGLFLSLIRDKQYSKIKPWQRPRSGCPGLLGAMPPATPPLALGTDLDDSSGEGVGRKNQNRVSKVCVPVYPTGTQTLRSLYS